MGLILSVYRPADSTTDCTNQGLTSRCNAITVVNADGPFNPTGERPAFMLVPGGLANTVRLVPAENAGTDEFLLWVPMAQNTKEYAGPMFGGNYAGTSDSRFGQAICSFTGQDFANGIVAVHDRLESWAANERLSR